MSTKVACQESQIHSLDFRLRGTKIWRVSLSKSPGYSERLLTAQETAGRLGVKRKTLYNWASTWEVERRGPEPLRMGGRALRYRESDVSQYIKTCRGLPDGGLDRR
ncbi:helix-turn-helix transcriptional regulator [Streptomyces rapamycinicus]|uniref:helix-turn-helix transcriptional regulator n=1 Tax=Streptomyces rapamycinicus TaxID=1226757 RepID=UPI000EF841D7|nr:helix-turn-helix domain-containing protein [Streptomyces rapamycinicus NRRL 5491]